MCFRYLYISVSIHSPRLYKDCWENGRGVQIAIHPLRLLNNIQARMDNELVHVLRGIRESKAGDTIATAFRSSKGDVEKRCIGGREDREVVRHIAVCQSFPGGMRFG